MRVSVRGERGGWECEGVNLGTLHFATFAAIPDRACPTNESYSFPLPVVVRVVRVAIFRSTEEPCKPDFADLVPAIGGEERWEKERGGEERSNEKRGTPMR